MHVFYRPEQVADTQSISRSAIKPKLVVEDWQAQGFDTAALKTVQM